MKEIRLIFILLIIASFGDVLRLSPDSPITLFRLLIPYSFHVIYKINHYFFRQFVSIICLFIILSFVQYFFTTTIWYPYIYLFSFTHLVVFLLHYITLFVVIGLVCCLWMLDQKAFFMRMVNYSSKFVKFCVFAYAVNAILTLNPVPFPLFSNINDFGCVLAAGIPAILFEESTIKYKKWIYIILILLILIYDDSKLALFGGVLEIMLYFIHRLSNNVGTRVRRFAMYLWGGLCTFGIVCFFTSDIEINGYSVHDIVMTPFRLIYEGEFFEVSNTSMTYRVNAIIGLIKIILDTFGVGVGAGSSGFILQDMMPNLGEVYGNGYLSSHIWWLEVMADIGWIFIIPATIIYIRQIGRFCSLNNSREQLFSQILILSFPLWCMSSSGLYTEYFSITLMSTSFVLFKNDLQKTSKSV